MSRSDVFYRIFQRHKAVIGMVHVHALPGTPKYTGNFQSVVDKALSEAEIYARNGVHAIMIENMHDVPYLKKTAGPEIVAAMSIVGHEIKKAFALPTGIQILAGANKQALASALAGNLDFIRVEGFVFGHLADEGIMESDAGELLRYRKHINAEHIAVFADIKKKHAAHQISADTGLTDHAKAAEFFMADGIIITGNGTGEPANEQELIELQDQTHLPILIGSGITANNLEIFFPLANGFIVGSYFKFNGRWNHSVDPDRVKKFMRIFNEMETE